MKVLHDLSVQRFEYLTIHTHGHVGPYLFWKEMIFFFKLVLSKLW